MGPGEKQAVLRLRAATGASIDVCHMAFVLGPRIVEVTAREIEREQQRERLRAPWQPRRGPSYRQRLRADWLARFYRPWPKRTGPIPPAPTVTLDWDDWAHALAAVLKWIAQAPAQPTLDDRWALGLYAMVRSELGKTMDAASAERGPVAFDAYLAERARGCLEDMVARDRRAAPAARAACARLSEALAQVPAEHTLLRLPPADGFGNHRPEPMFDLCPLPMGDGMIDLPPLTGNRAGMPYTPSDEVSISAAAATAFGALARLRETHGFFIDPATGMPVNKARPDTNEGTP